MLFFPLLNVNFRLELSNNLMEVWAFICDKMVRHFVWTSHWTYRALEPIVKTFRWIATGNFHKIIVWLKFAVHPYFHSLHDLLLLPSQMLRDTDLQVKQKHKTCSYNSCLATSEVCKRICPFAEAMLALPNQVVFIQELSNPILLFLY